VKQFLAGHLDPASSGADIRIAGGDDYQWSVDFLEGLKILKPADVGIKHQGGFLRTKVADFFIGFLLRNRVGLWDCQRAAVLLANSKLARAVSGLPGPL
jgi:hypothetical protein